CACAHRGNRQYAAETRTHAGWTTPLPATGNGRQPWNWGLTKMTAPEVHAKPAITSIDFNEQPFILAWELTRACNLACVHCRAEAQLRRAPGELSFAEARNVIDQIASFPAPPILVLTGGDPMRRMDIVSLVEYGSGKGLRCTVTP